MPFGISDQHRAFNELHEGIEIIAEPYVNRTEEYYDAESDEVVPGYVGGDMETDMIAVDFVENYFGHKTAAEYLVQLMLQDPGRDQAIVRKLAEAVGVDQQQD